MKIKTLLMSLFCMTFSIGLALAQVTLPEVKIQDDYDDSEYQQAFQALKENIGAIEANLDETIVEGRPSNSDRLLTPNQSLRKVQEEIPNHQRAISNSSRPSNQRSTPNDATRNPNQRSILVK